MAALNRHGVQLPEKESGSISHQYPLLSGTVTYPEPLEPPLDLASIGRGLCVISQAVPCSDLELDIPGISLSGHQPTAEESWSARVVSLKRFTDEVMRLRLSPEQATGLAFTAGQYVNVITREGNRRAFSIASPPSCKAFIELHIRKVQTGRFTHHVFDGMAPGDRLQLEGPLGGLNICPRSTRPILMMGGGTGFAPLKSMIEERMNHDPDASLSLFWGAATSADLYASDLIERWSGRNADFRFVPVLTDPEPEWSGERGFVHEAVLRHHRDLSPFDIYMAGPPPMVEAARRQFLAAGAQIDRLFYDA
ncbi:MAG: NAD(P)H-flavin reductase [Pseudomonadota bacterium]